MSDEGEKTCPLCAEEMDLTDQQLKPCKCGYEVCVAHLIFGLPLPFLYFVQLFILVCLFVWGISENLLSCFIILYFILEAVIT